MNDKINCKLLKPFGSTIAKSVMPDELIKDFLEDLESIRTDEKKIEAHKFGHKLAGQIEKELLITPQIMLKWKRMFFDHIIRFYTQSHYPKSDITNIKINSAWHNVMKPNDYNPCHTHSQFQLRDVNPDLSCVGYLKLPESITNYKNAKPHHNIGGFIEFTEGTEGMFTNANYLIPVVQGEYFLFPSTLRHCVYSWNSENPDDERISFSFNATLTLTDKTQNEQV